MCVYVCAMVCDIRGNHRTTCESEFSSITWVLGLELGLSGLVTGTFAC